MKKMFLLFFVLAVVLFQGCKSQTCVIANTGTVIGGEIIWDFQSQVPRGRMGYGRHELAIVPTNRAADGQNTQSGQGAKDSPNVLMEFNFTNFFSLFRESDIYQRVAVGDKAVTQPGAVMMFVKDSKGEISDKTSAALSAIMALKSSSDNLEQLDQKSDMVDYVTANPDKKEKAVSLLKNHGISNWDSFIDGQPRELQQSEIIEIMTELKK